ncbi:gustatory receptor 89 [Tribolium castaneum]|uniref:Gustatory receptor n=1 Tax=Tribolium castaneum TaxID=7070 RepID=D7EHZ2_TRICA|nr:PREDICTED: putative gustatory receptor 2a [Tribolium castaneum]EFA12700.1 gustatory receptor 89 [Tribolium castaneum]|eukprot:XP_015840061.1 PREDICTED: putative gustatory receptor 2a [Tribolium castaneum]
MKRYKELTSKKFVKILQTISAITALSVPDLFTYGGLPVIYILYSILIAFTLVALSVYTLYFKVIYFYKNLLATVSILDSVTIASVTLTNVLSIFFAVIFRRRKIVSLVKNLQEIERVLNEKFQVSCEINEKSLLIVFGLLETFLFSYIAFDCVSQIRTHGFFLYSLSVVMHLNVFLVSITVSQVQLFSTCIKQYFSVVNEQLATTKVATIKMKFFLQTYDKLCDIVDLVSDSYGIQIACVTFIIIICLIESLNLLMKCALRVQTLGEVWPITLLIADTWNSIIYILFGIILSICCQQVSNEANNTSVLSYKILLNFPSRPKSQNDEINKSELLLLAEHLSQRRVKFSAAGLFDVDHTMLYMIFGSIAAYLVIVLQFK